jgi:hypothetical protein
MIYFIKNRISKMLLLFILSFILWQTLLIPDCLSSLEEEKRNSGAEADAKLSGEGHP